MVWLMRMRLRGIRRGGSELWWIHLCLAATMAAVVADDTMPLKQLPLYEVHASTDCGGRMAVMLSGDEGWGRIDKVISHALADHGVSVVGFSSVRYFWRRRTPNEAADALAKILNHYLQAWDKKRAVIVGYSRGAAVAPFMIARLSPELRGRVELLAMLAPPARIDFEFHVMDWILDRDHARSLPLRPEIEALHALPVLCVCGQTDAHCDCGVADGPAASVIMLPGGHTFGRDYKTLARQIVERLPCQGSE